MVTLGGFLCAHGVSYHQTYTWVKKYLTEGETGLSDRRGHHKADDEVDETERLRRENFRLKRQPEEREDVRLGKVRFEAKYLVIQHFHAENG